MSSSFEDYDSIEVNGPRVIRYSRWEESSAQPRPSRRPSDASPTTNHRHPPGAVGTQDVASHVGQQAAQTPARHPIVIQSSSSNPASSPLSQTTTGGRTTSTSATDSFGSSPITHMIPEPRRLPRQSAFESQLSGLLEEFANIESGDYKACYAFAKRYPEIWERDEKVLLKDAVAALVASKEPHAKRCIQRAVMIQECADLSPSKIRTFFESLINKKKSTLERYLKECNDATAKIKAKLPASFATTSERPVPQDPDPVAALGSVSLQGGQFRTTVDSRPVDRIPGSTTGRHQDTPSFMSLQSGHSRYQDEKRSADQFSGSTIRTHQDTSTRHDAKITYTRTAAAGAVRRRGASDVPTVVVDSDGRTVDVLDQRYQIRTSSANFFTFGRVFATPWHTALGANQAKALKKWVVQDCFGEFILTHIQRMVVVKEGHGFSWCVPISTYAGRGVAKPGLHDRDRLAHAIIYMEGTDARPTAAERDMMDKNPIAVHAAAGDQKLDEMSRINFGKVHTIEHNVKVMNVGKISPDDLDDFRSYWNDHR